MMHTRLPEIEQAVIDHLKQHEDQHSIIIASGSDNPPMSRADVINHITEQSPTGKQIINDLILLAIDQEVQHM